jgi:hypothetical protein
MRLQQCLDPLTQANFATTRPIDEPLQIIGMRWGIQKDLPGLFLSVVRCKFLAKKYVDVFATLTNAPFVVCLHWDSCIF